MPFRAEIKHLQGAEKLPYKEYHPRPQNATETKISLLQSITKSKPTDRTQHQTENTDGEPPKTPPEPPNVSPHISERPQKENASQSKKAAAGKKKKLPEHIPEQLYFIL